MTTQDPYADYEAALARYSEALARLEAGDQQPELETTVDRLYEESLSAYARLSAGQPPAPAAETAIPDFAPAASEQPAADVPAVEDVRAEVPSAALRGRRVRRRLPRSTSPTCRPARCTGAGAANA